MKAIPLLIILIGLNIASKGQSLARNDSTPQKSFDFWIGSWNLTWEAPDGSTEYGTNKVEKILNGKVIQEHFKAVRGRFKGYTGKSWSIYASGTQQWKQTWVDSNGGYITLTGDLGDGRRMFVTETEMEDGQKMLQRMVFYDIGTDSFTWDWEMSSDYGKSWKLQWRIFYERK